MGNLDTSQVIRPDIVEGAPTDVIQSNPEKQQDRQQRFNPLAGGILVWNARLSHSPGTLGAIVFDADTSQPMGLSNHHVFFGIDGTGKTGDNIAQPDTVDNADVIGTLARGDPDMDSAVCTLNNAREISRVIEGYSGRPGGPDKPTGVMQPLVGMRVTKSGASTEITYGIIDGISPDGKEFTVIPDPDHPSPNGEISAGGIPVLCGWKLKALMP